MSTVSLAYRGLATVLENSIFRSFEGSKEVVLVLASGNQEGITSIYGA